MSIGPKRHIRAATLVVVPTLLVLVATAPARADGAMVTHQVVKDTATMPFTNPCTGETGTATITFTAVFEKTDRPVDTFSLVSNIAGDFVLVLDSGPTITGHFANTFVIGGGENLTLASVLTAEGNSSDGSRFSLHFMIVQAENGFAVMVVDLTMC